LADVWRPRKGRITKPPARKALPDVGVTERESEAEPVTARTIRLIWRRLGIVPITSRPHTRRHHRNRGGQPQRHRRRALRRRVQGWVSGIRAAHDVDLTGLRTSALAQVIDFVPEQHMDRPKSAASRGWCPWPSRGARGDGAGGDRDRSERSRATDGNRRRPRHWRRGSGVRRGPVPRVFPDGKARFIPSPLERTATYPASSRSR
jgi:hypothetical protein